MNKSLIIGIATFIFTFFSVGLSTSFAQSGNSSDMLKQSINSSYKKLTQAIKDGDAAKIASQFYTEDAKFYPPNGGVAEGRMQIEQAFGGLINAGLVVSPEAQEVERLGDAVYEYGIATLHNKEGKMLGKERYIVIWKKEGDSWKMYRDFVKGIQINKSDK